MNNIETDNDVTVIHPIQSDKYDINNCVKIAKLNALNKQLFNNCCGASCGISCKTASKSIANGSIDANIMFVDAFPSEYETFTGCLTDEKGYFLDDCLKDSKVKRSDIYCTTLIKCFNVQDTNNDIINNCLKCYFLKELELVKPERVILTYSAFQACLKYQLIPALGNVNYFNGLHTRIGNYETNIYIVFDIGQLTDSQKNTFKQGLNYIV